MNKYNNGKIYKISSIHTEDIYIGSTTKPLNKRLIHHKSDFKRYQSGNFPYLTSFDILKHGDCTIELIENVNVETKKELHDRERYYIENLSKVVNFVIPNRNIKEWNEANKEYLKDYQRIMQQKSGTNKTKK